jgi:hypothetical protein
VVDIELATIASFKTKTRIPPSTKSVTHPRTYWNESAYVRTSSGHTSKKTQENIPINYRNVSLPEILGGFEMLQYTLEVYFGHVIV